MKTTRDKNTQTFSKHFNIIHLYSQPFSTQAPATPKYRLMYRFQLESLCLCLLGKEESANENIQCICAATEWGSVLMGAVGGAAGLLGETEAKRRWLPGHGVGTGCLLFVVT